MTVIVWFTRDLRVHDHPALRAALDSSAIVVPVFCLDDRLLTGRHASGPRTQFMLECLADLRSRLDGRLVIRRGPPERELPELARCVEASEVHFSADSGPFARRRIERVTHALGEAGVECRSHPGCMPWTTPPWCSPRPASRTRCSVRSGARGSRCRGAR